MFQMLREKYKHFRRHLEYLCHFDFAGLATNFFTREQCKKYHISKN
jgi:hypothetical protein